MLTIKHLTGPLAGTAQPIEASVDRVVFGRQLDCTVTYPAEAVLVARHHFALVRKASGDWTIDLFGHPFVAVDGRPAEQGQVVENGTHIELGQLQGPSFQTVLDAEGARSNYLPTAPQAEVVGARALAERAGSRASFARLAGLFAIILAIAAAAFGVSQYYSSKSSFAQLTDAITRAGDAEKSLADLSIGSVVRDHLAHSVYRVVIQNTVNNGLSGLGTAWPVGPHLLATNAHVAGEKLPANTVLKVLEPGSGGHLFAVVGQRIHPAYAAFIAFVDRDPIAVKNHNGQPAAANISIPGYDVALLEIRETLPPEQIFKLAGPDEYKALHTGQPLATAGYPSEGMSGDNAGAIRATPEFHLGNVTGLTNFFFLPADEEHRQLIHDDLPAAGGASGSPIVDNKGNVVALLNAGNSFTVKELQGIRIPSGALVNYAQRVDMLQELLDHREDKALERHRAYWQQQMAYFQRGIDLLVPKVVDEAKPHPDSVATRVFDQTVTLTSGERHAQDGGGTQRQLSTQVAVTPGSNYVFIAYGLKTTSLELYLMVGDKLVDSAKGSWYPSIKYKVAGAADQRAREWFPSLAAASKTDVAVNLWVVSADEEDVTCVLRAYRIDDKAPSG